MDIAIIADNTKNLDGAKAVFANSLLQKEITLPNGFKIQRPNEWR